MRITFNFVISTQGVFFQRDKFYSTESRLSIITIFKHAVSGHLNCFVSEQSEAGPPQLNAVIIIVHKQMESSRCFVGWGF